MTTIDVAHVAATNAEKARIEAAIATLEDQIGGRIRSTLSTPELRHELQKRKDELIVVNFEWLKMNSVWQRELERAEKDAEDARARLEISLKAEEEKAKLIAQFEAKKQAAAAAKAKAEATKRKARDARCFRAGAPYLPMG